jgi:hypothetical protein
MNCPLFCLAIFDNAQIKIFSINGQFMKSFSCNAKYFGRMKDSDLNGILFYFEDTRMVCLSTPDLRSISEF